MRLAISGGSLPSRGEGSSGLGSTCHPLSVRCWRVLSPLWRRRLPLHHVWVDEMLLWGERVAVSHLLWVPHWGGGREERSGSACWRSRSGVVGWVLCRARGRCARLGKMGGEGGASAGDRVVRGGHGGGRGGRVMRRRILRSELQAIRMLARSAVLWRLLC